MPKLDSLIREIGALETSIEKNASKSSSRLASFLDKIAEEAECDKDKEDDKEDDEKDNKKEGSMRNSEVMKIARAIKLAVLDNDHTQGSTIQVGPKSGDGAATNAAREEDQLINASEVEYDADANPERHYTSTSSDLIKDEPVNEKDMAKALKEGRLILMTDKEAAVLNKFAGLGYNYVVDTYSNQIVQEKIAEQVIAQQAAEAPTKIASLINYNNDVSTVQKLASLKRNDPAAFAALRTLAKRGLI